MFTYRSASACAEIRSNFSLPKTASATLDRLRPRFGGGRSRHGPRSRPLPAGVRDGEPLGHCRDTLIQLIVQRHVDVLVRRCAVGRCRHVHVEAQAKRRPGHVRRMSRLLPRKGRGRLRGPVPGILEGRGVRFLPACTPPCDGTSMRRKPCRPTASGQPADGSIDKIRQMDRPNRRAERHIDKRLRYMEAEGVRDRIAETNTSFTMHEPAA